MWIRIRNLGGEVADKQICDDADPDPNFHFDADPDPTFRSHADQDPTFQFDADADPELTTHYFKIRTL